jgi:hypothetical protein
VKEEDTEGYKVIGWVFLILAFIVLLIAFMMRGIENWWGVLIIIGVILTFLGGIICFQKEEKKQCETRNPC